MDHCLYLFIYSCLLFYISSFDLHMWGIMRKRCADASSSNPFMHRRTSHENLQFSVRPCPRWASNDFFITKQLSRLGPNLGKFLVSLLNQLFKTKKHLWIPLSFVNHSMITKLIKWNESEGRLERTKKIKWSSSNYKSWNISKWFEQNGNGCNKSHAIGN